MKKLVSIYRFSKEELHKVIFPTKEQIRSAFISVIVVVSVITLFLGLVDLIFSVTVTGILK